MSRKVILTGNGLSVGLNKDFALPNITKRFFERLPTEHKSFVKHHMDKLGKGDYIQTDFEEAIASIEQTYDSLKNYYDFLVKGEDGDEFLKAYDLGRTEIERHLEAIQEIIYEYTSSILDLIDGHVRWKEIGEKLSGFIEWLTVNIEEADQIDLFTLNFDLLLETILLETIGTDRFLDYHARGEKWPLIDNDLRYSFSPDLSMLLYGKRNVRLHHLHGSLSSFKNIKDGKLFKITTEALRYHQVYDEILELDIVPSIVTGGGKSVKIQQNPFQFYYKEFKRNLVNEERLCEELYIIGYSFRDDHINKDIATRLSYERKKDNPKMLNKLLIVDYKTTDEEKKIFIDEINTALGLGPRMANRFKYDDERIIFTGANSLSSLIKS
ncbi:SIR2 family protein [Peribacillus simplex]|uniref:SIR2 family protein n=1 Tax=Peribacillus simplex TaxID=1478 RepID=UPI0024C10BA0|nr:SIR2 family protein [Peribacillus simplex]WHY97357.1 SIR2 family protein [Peribacillus simplex]